MKVLFSKAFEKFIDTNLNATDQKKIFDFKSSVEKHGLTGLPGRNKKSDNPNPNSPTYADDLNHAYEFKLWHYHIDIRSYNTSKGFGHYTSEFVLHYQRFSDGIKIVRMDNHSPFVLPTKVMMEKQREDLEKATKLSQSIYNNPAFEHANVLRALRQALAN